MLNKQMHHKPWSLVFLCLVLAPLLLSCDLNSYIIAKASNLSISPPADSPVVPTAPRLKALKATYDTPTQVSFSWQKEISSESIDGYRISYQLGQTPPSDCSTYQLSEFQVTSPNVTINALTPNTDYSFRVCAVKGTAVSDGLTMSITTLPLCDYSVATGSLDNGTAGGLVFANVVDGVDSYLEFHNFLAAANANGDTNADGMIGICLLNGLEIRHTNALPAGYIHVTGNNFVIYANSGETVTFNDQRTNPTGGNNAFIRFEGLNESMMNITMLDSSDAIPIVSAFGEIKELVGLTITDNAGSVDGTITATSGKIKRIHNVNLTSSPVSSNRGAIYFFGDNVSEISSATILTGGNSNNGIYNRFANTSKVVVKDSNITTTGNFSHGISIDVNTDGVTIQNTTITTTGNNSNGILNWNGKITDLSNTTIQTQGTSSSAIFSQNGQITSFTNSTIKVKGDTSHGLFLSGIASVLKMEKNNFIRESTNAAFTGSAIVFDSGVNNYVDTAQIKNNTFCESSSTLSNWTFLLAVNTTPITGFSSATVPYDGVTFGAQTFPWGDSSTLTNGNQNLQTKWGGICP